MARGGKREGAGRPVGSRSVSEKDALSSRIAFRLTAEERKLLEERAASENMNLSSYIHKKLFE